MPSLGCSLLAPARIMRWWPAPPGQGPGALGHSTGFLEGSAQQHLDVGIQAAELIGRPPGQGIVDGGIDAKQYLLAITHGS
jgi:hypothetical protein